MPPGVPPSQKTPPVVLCIDDEPACLRYYQQILEDAGYQIVPFMDGRLGLEFLGSDHVDLAVIDYSMPQMSGAEVARMIRNIKPGLPIIMVSSWPECPEDARQWVNHYLVKATGSEGLTSSIEKLLQAREVA
jgi:CheY-like chemotaxis protein